MSSLEVQICGVQKYPIQFKSAAASSSSSSSSSETQKNHNLENG